MRILFLTPRPPWPIRRGDQVRVARLAVELAGRHEVAVVTLRPPGFPPCPWPAAIAGREVPVRWAGMLAGAAHSFRLPVQVALHRSAVFAGAVEREVARLKPDVAIVVLSRLGCVLPSLGRTPAVLDLVDSLQLNLANRARRQPLLAPLLRWEAHRIGAWDRRLARAVAHTTVVSERDRADLLRADATLAERISVLPAAVAVGDEAPLPRGGEIVLLHGNLGYFPTADGALWFAREVWPGVRSLHPQAQWWLAGARPSRALIALARLPGVRVLANPESLDEVVARAAVVIGPLLTGSGTPNKVLEAMAAGVPAVITPQAAEGLDRLGGDEVAIAAEPDGFARAVARLLADGGAARAQANAAWGYVRRVHALPVVAAQLEAILAAAARPSEVPGRTTPHG